MFGVYIISGNRSTILVLGLDTLIVFIGYTKSPRIEQYLHVVPNVDREKTAHFFFFRDAAYYAM